MNRGSERNRIISLSVFCTKEESPEVQGFWIEANGNHRECYIFVESNIQRISYGKFLIQMGLVDADKKGEIEKITIEQFEKELKLGPALENLQIIDAPAAVEKATARKKLLSEIRDFVGANSDPSITNKTDFQIESAEMDRKFGDLLRSLQRPSTNAGPALAPR